MLAISRRGVNLGQEISPSVNVPPEVATAINALSDKVDSLLKTISQFKIRLEHQVILPPPNDVISRALPAILTMTVLVGATFLITKKLLTSSDSGSRKHAGATSR